MDERQIFLELMVRELGRAELTSYIEGYKLGCVESEMREVGRNTHSVLLSSDLIVQRCFSLSEHHQRPGDKEGH